MWEVSMVTFPDAPVPVVKRLPDAYKERVTDNMCYLITLVAWAAIVMLGIIRGGI